MAEKGSEVRISETLSKGEQESIASRKEVVKEGLAKLGIQCDKDKIPNIAVLGSGGGLRAMIALYGTLSELKKHNLLDCIMYLSGVSGSTWCMSSLYKDENWGEKIEELEDLHLKRLASNQWDIMAALKAAMEAARDGCFSLTDVWAYFGVYQMMKELDESTLPEQKRSCENGKNPYPIYAAVDKYTYSGHHPGSWFEFTPHEVGAPGSGVYVDTEKFGSIFRDGQLTEKTKQKSVSYLQGLWGSCFGSEEEIKNYLLDTLKNIFNIHPRPVKSRSSSLDIGSQNPGITAYQHALDLQMYAMHGIDTGPEESFGHLEHILISNNSSKSYEVLKQIQDNWPSSDATTRKEACINLLETLEMEWEEQKKEDETAEYSFLSIFENMKDFISLSWKIKTCLLNWKWGDTNNFMHNCSGVKVPELKQKPILSLIDAGTAINCSYPLILRPERNVKLILSFDFGIGRPLGDPFQTIKKAAAYCRDRGISFPKIDEEELEETRDPSDCYIFRGDNVTVMHFPLFNQVNSKDKIAAHSWKFGTSKINYSDTEIKELLTIAKANVASVHGKIVKEIERIVDSQKA